MARRNVRTNSDRPRRLRRQYRLAPSRRNRRTGQCVKTRSPGVRRVGFRLHGCRATPFDSICDRARDRRRIIGARDPIAEALNALRPASGPRPRNSGPIFGYLSLPTKLPRSSLFSAGHGALISPGRPEWVRGSSGPRMARGLAAKTDHLLHAWDRHEYGIRRSLPACFKGAESAAGKRCRDCWAADGASGSGAAPESIHVEKYKAARHEGRMMGSSAEGQYAYVPATEGWNRDSAKPRRRWTGEVRFAGALLPLGRRGSTRRRPLRDPRCRES